MNYLQWLSRTTETAWWHDSGDPAELQQALGNGAVGVTTNPVLCAQALAANKEHWSGEIRDAMSREPDPKARAESLMKIVVVHAARQLQPVFESTVGAQGYVCAQVDPSSAGNRQAMYEMAVRLNAWAPNIVVKLPATSAGLDVMERCCGEGMAVTVTLSFSVSQVMAVGARHQQVVRNRRVAGRVGKCFAVIMIGRIDDYLREVAADSRKLVTEQEIRMAGLSVVKRAYQLYLERGYEATLLVAALRGNHHMTGLAGGKLIMSIHPSIQKALLEQPVVRGQGIDEPIPRAVQENLGRLPEFVKAHDPRGLSEEQMLSYGLTQRTLSQFIESGWRQLEQFRP
jgi:transaldolase